MTCSDLESLIQPYLDGEFEGADRFELERHLGACERCAREVRQQAALQEALRARLRAAAGREAPPSLRAKVSAGLRAERRRHLHRGLARYVAAAAVLALAVGAWALIRPSLSRDRLAAEAALRHARGLPYEIEQVTPERAEQWFQGKLDHKVAVPRLHNATVAGARLSHLQDRPAAYISYKVPCPSGSGAQKKMGLFVVDDSRDSVAAAEFPQIEVANRHGYNVAMWKQGEVVYELVSDLDEADIRRLLLDQRATAAAPAQLEVRPVLHAHERP